MKSLIVGKGLELSQGADGHWLNISAGDYEASICIENMQGIAREAFTEWAKHIWTRRDTGLKRTVVSFTAEEIQDGLNSANTERKHRPSRTPCPTCHGAGWVEREGV